MNEAMYRLGSTRSGIRELFEYAQKRAREVGPENVFDFSLGNPSVPCPDVVTETLRQLLEEDPVQIHAYTSAQGLLSTRQAVAHSLNRRFGVSAGPEDVFMCCGAAAGLTTAIRALTTDADSEFIVPAPYFAEYGVFVPQQGGRFVAVPADAENRFALQVEAIAEAVTKSTRAILINTPNNPSGHVVTRQRLGELARLLEEKKRQFGQPLYLLSDEPYRELVYGEQDIPFIPTLYRNTVVIYSFSKALSLPGERIGYVFVPPEATRAKELMAAILGSARAMGYVCAPSLFQRLVERTIDVRPDIEPYDINRRLLSQGLREAGYDVIEPDGAFYLFVRAPGGDARQFSQKAKEKDVLVVPGDAFGCPGWLRISYCIRRETIEGALPRFRALMQED